MKKSTAVALIAGAAVGLYFVGARKQSNAAVANIAANENAAFWAQTPQEFTSNLVSRGYTGGTGRPTYLFGGIF